MSFAKALSLTAASLIIASVAPAAAPDAAYIQQIRSARTDRVTELVKPDSWLSLVGLQFLEPGDNSIEAEGVRLGTAILTAGNQVAVTRAAAAPATLSILVIDRGGKKALRIRDSAAAARRDFHGLDYFPIDPSWRIEARWVPYPGPHSVAITNVLGQVSRETAPGKAVFERGGKTYELVPVVEAPGQPLFFIIGDETSGKETYQMRFLDAELPRDGKVILDFNLAENPPCAFTDFATCPLPPQGNRLPLAITAGEKKYRGAKD